MLTRIYPVTFSVISVLLMVWVVVTTPLNWACYKPYLPLTHNPDLLLNLDPLPHIHIYADGNRYLDGEWLPPGVEPLKEEKAAMIVLWADARLPFGTVKKAIVMLQGNGPRHVYLLVCGERSRLDRIAEQVSVDLQTRTFLFLLPI